MKKRLFGFFQQAENEANNGQDEEDKENDLCDLYRTSGDACEAEYACDDGDDEKYNGVIKHWSSFQKYDRAISPNENPSFLQGRHRRHQRQSRFAVG